jgi:beta-ureidopropionase
VRERVLCPWLAVNALLIQSLLPAAPPDHAAQPGRPVKVAAIVIGTGGEHEKKLKLAIEQLQTAGTNGVDIACLPELFSGRTAEPIAGPTTKAIGELARKHRMYVICPIREQAANNRQYNTAVLLDRNGKIAGYYRKVFPVWGEGVRAGEEGVKVFDTDFGRIAILICFDANFDELWQEAEHRGAEIVFWPSAYGGGLPLNGYAMIHNYDVVAVGWGTMIDRFGKNEENVEQPRPQQFVATFDLDVTIIHKDFNAEKYARLVREHRDEVEEMPNIGPMEGWHVLRAIKPGVHVRELCKQYEIETLREYRHRSREQINELRRTGKPI